MAGKSKILIIGSTGYIGKYMVEESTKAGHPTFALVRQCAASNPDKSQLIESFKNSGVTVLYGDITDHQSLVKAIRHVDVVISAVGLQQIPDQINILNAIKEAGIGNIKRFIPSEFGLDVDRHHAVEPAKTLFGVKAKIRRAIEAEGIPYTYVVSNAFAGYFLPNLGQLNAASAPRDKVVILGDGNVKGAFVYEEDVATYTIKTADDPRTLNKSLYMKPPANILTFNELVYLWEKKIGKNLEKIYVPEEQILKNIQESPFPLNYILAISHASLVRGDITNYDIESSFGMEACELYPEVEYTTVDNFLSQFV